MLSLYDYDNASRLEYVHQSVRNLAGHALLYLRPAREDIYQPGQLGKPGNLPFLVGDIPDMRVPEKGCEMMLAGRVHFDVAHQHHLVVVSIEDCGQHVLGPLRESGELLRVGPRHPGRRFAQAVSLWILADGEQDLAYRPLNPGVIEVRAQGRGPGLMTRAGRAVVHGPDLSQRADRARAGARARA